VNEATGGSMKDEDTSNAEVFVEFSEVQSFRLRSR
jgi:cold shock CspA family protein